MRGKQIKYMTHTGLFAGLVYLSTWLFHIPVGVSGGYVHFGDAMVYVAATILPTPYAMAASAIGAGLSDLMSPGGAVWLLPTVLIKPLCCLAFTNRRDTALCPRNIAAIFVAGLVTVAGYLAAGVVIGGVGGAVASIIPNTVQAVGSGICFLALAAVLEKTKLRAALLRRLNSADHHRSAQ